MSNSKKSKNSMKKPSKEITSLKDPNMELGVKVSFILMMWSLIDSDIVTKDNFEFVKERFKKNFEMYSERRLNLENIIKTLKEEYNYKKFDF